MAVVVATNIAAINAQRSLDRSNSTLGVHMARLASGLRINQAADDAAGLAISEKLISQIRGFGQARRNAANGISVTQTADGAMAEINSILSRMKELAVQASDGALTTNDRKNIHTEFTQMRTEIDRIANSVEFNGKRLLNGATANISFQVGINNTSDDRITVSLADSNVSALGLTTATLSSAAGAQGVLSLVETAINSVTDRRGRLGAAQNRFGVTLNVLATVIENLSAANSRIRDADVAEESAMFARSQVLVQAGSAILAQANQLPSLALNLLPR